MMCPAPPISGAISMPTRGIAMRTTSAVVAATAAALVAGALLGAPSATAVADTTAPVVKRVDVRPETVGLYKDRASRVTVRVRVTDDVGVDEVVAGLLSERDEDAGQEFPLELMSGTPQDGVWGATLFTDKREVTGLWAGYAVAQDAAGNESPLDETTRFDEFWVKRNTMIRGFNVREPAVKGSYLRMSGRLLRLDPVRGYVGYRDKVIHVLFRAKGSPTLVKVGEIRTSATGSFANTRRFRARTDGTWLVLFNGTSNYLPEVSHRDFVDVT